MKYRNKKYPGFIVEARKCLAGVIGLDGTPRGKMEQLTPNVDFWQITDGFGQKWIATDSFMELYEPIENTDPAPAF